MTGRESAEDSWVQRHAKLFFPLPLLWFSLEGGGGRREASLFNCLLFSRGIISALYHFNIQFLKKGLPEPGFSNDSCTSIQSRTYGLHGEFRATGSF